MLDLFHASAAEQTKSQHGERFCEKIQDKAENICLEANVEAHLLL